MRRIPQDRHASAPVGVALDQTDESPGGRKPEEPWRHGSHGRATPHDVQPCIHSDGGFRPPGGSTARRECMAPKDGPHRTACSHASAPVGIAPDQTTESPGGRKPKEPWRHGSHGRATPHDVQPCIHSDGGFRPPGGSTARRECMAPKDGPHRTACSHASAPVGIAPDQTTESPGGRKPKEPWRHGSHGRATPHDVQPCIHSDGGFRPPGASSAWGPRLPPT